MARPTEILSRYQDFLDFTRQNEEGHPASEWETLANGTRIHIGNSGILTLEPANPASRQADIVLSAAIHGNETAPIEYLNNLVAEALRGDWLVGNRVLVLFGNPRAMNRAVRFEKDDMNRLFCGKHQGEAVRGTPEAIRAAILEAAVTEFYQAYPQEVDGRSVTRLHYDMHTAIRGSVFEKFAIYPFPHGKDWNREQLAFLTSCGVNTVLLQSTISPTFSYFTRKTFDAEGFTLELGKVEPWGQNDLSRYQAVIDHLRGLIQAQPLPVAPFDNAAMNLFEVKGEVIKHTDQFKLNIANDVPNFTGFQKGFVLAEDEPEGYVVQEDDERIVFPNPKVKNGLRAGIMVRRVTI